MSTTNISLRDYEAAERAIAHEGATTGVIVHGIITLLVAGLLAHWWFGYVRLDDQLNKQQQKTEARATQMR